jgi:hypothetical protein
MTTALTDEERDRLIGKLSRWVDEGRQLIAMLEGNRNGRTPGVEMKARLVPEGSYFRGRGGGVLYRRVSDSAAKHCIRDTTRNYGIDDSGNMASFDPEMKIVAIPPPNWQEDDEVWRELMTELGLYEEPEEDK